MCLFMSSREHQRENEIESKMSKKSKIVPGKTYYEILNLTEGANKAQIKKSYRKLVKL